MDDLKDFIAQVKARVRVSDVVSQRVKLKRRGKEFVGLSPFTSEKSPSFTVNDDKQFWHCFSSGLHGDIISFLQRLEGLSFHEALEKVSQRAGLIVPRLQPQTKEEEEKKASLKDALAFASSFYQHSLFKEEGLGARHYLHKRGLNTETIKDLHIGFAPSKTGDLITLLKQRGFSIQDMDDVGLIVQKDGRQPRERFWNRLIFPIFSPQKEVVGFGGRALEETHTPKYLNSPQTPFFHKGYILYNEHNARDFARTEKQLLLVEGYMDVATLWQHGIRNVIAPLGTAVTPQQILRCWRLSPEPILCFDGDAAGQRAAQRAMERFLPLLEPGLSCKICFLPQGLDPDDLVKTEGPGALEKLLSQAQSLSAFLFNTATSRISNNTTPEESALVEEDLKNLIASIQSSSVRENYKGQLLAQWRTFSFEHNRQRFFNRSHSTSTHSNQRRASEPVKHSSLTRSGVLWRDYPTMLLLSSVLIYPVLGLDYGERLERLAIEDIAIKGLRHDTLTAIALQPTIDSKHLLQQLTKNGSLSALDKLAQNPLLHIAAELKQAKGQADHSKISATLRKWFEKNLEECEKKQVLAEDMQLFQEPSLTSAEEDDLLANMRLLHARFIQSKTPQS